MSSYNLRAAFARDEMSIPGLLMMHQPYRSVTIDSFQESQSPIPYKVVQATLIFSEQPRSVSVRHFGVIEENGVWRIDAVAELNGQ